MTLLNQRQLQYAVLLSETGSFSHLAEKLNISQPALSKHILSLEKELGVQLFDRTETPLKMTAAGEYFVKEAKKLLDRENRLLHSMEQFRSGEKGQLTIGITPFRSAYLIPSVVKRVREKFPGVRVRLIEEGSDQLRKDAADGRFDFAVINMPVDETVLDATPIEPDKLAIVYSRELCGISPELDEADRVDFSQCEALSFVVLGVNQEMRVLFEKLCAASDIYPQIAVEAVNMTTAWELACTGAGATLLPLQFVNSAVADGKLIVKRLKNDVQLRQPAVVTKRGEYVSPYARYAIELLVGER
ncbi:MAG: LysR family transcriptional regulator [Ruminococcaceae bacterium]|nr:LysR family transcriptional regulator [Oscillospiraceae bacterium]